MAQYLRMLLDTIRERLYQTDYWIMRFRDVADKFLSLLSLLKGVAADFGLYGLS